MMKGAWGWEEFMRRKDMYDSRVCFKCPGIHGWPPQCWHDNWETAETDDTEGLTAYKWLAKAKFVCLKAGVYVWEKYSIMFVKVRNPTVWPYIQLWLHINFHCKNKWLYDKHFDVSVIVIFERRAPVNGSFALQVVVQSYLEQLCLSTLLRCWIRVFIAQFIICSSRAMNNISPSLNMKWLCFADRERGIWTSCLCNPLADALRRYLGTISCRDQNQVRQWVILRTLLYLPGMIFCLSPSNVWNEKMLKHSQLKSMVLSVS